MAENNFSSSPKRIALVTDAWFPQVNGVVRTLSEMKHYLEQFGHTLLMITPDMFWNLPCPTYPEIRLAISIRPSVAKLLADFSPDSIHIATEGPLGLAARRYCLKHGLAFTTAFHTKFPEYVETRFYIPARWIYAWIRRFHNAGSRTLVATPTLKRELESRGFTNTSPWTRGVDTQMFHPSKRADLGYVGPVITYVGRVSIEKNIEAFMALDVPGTKLVVGDGPERARLEAQYHQVQFVGAKHGEELARYYASSDVFIFPSRTDTFGLVMLEALASGVPVAAYPVTGPIDVVTDPKAGVLHDDLTEATRRALTLNREDCRRYAEKFSWENCARILEASLVNCRS